MTVRRRGSCSCRKVCYTSWRRAEKTRRRLGADHVYFCPEAGGYHFTSWSRADFDRITAARRPQLRRDAGYEQPGGNPGDILGAGWGQEIGPCESGDNVGESPATSPAERVGILLVGPETGARGEKVRRSYP